MSCSASTTTALLSGIFSQSMADTLPLHLSTRRAAFVWQTSRARRPAASWETRVATTLTTPTKDSIHNTTTGKHSSTQATHATTPPPSSITATTISSSPKQTAEAPSALRSPKPRKQKANSHTAGQGRQRIMPRTRCIASLAPCLPKRLGEWWCAARRRLSSRPQ